MYRGFRKLVEFYAHTHTQLVKLGTWYCRFCVLAFPPFIIAFTGFVCMYWEVTFTFWPPLGVQLGSKNAYFIVLQ